MLLRNFRVNCIIRVVFLLLTMLLSLWLIFVHHYYFSGLIVIAFLFIQTFDLIQYVERTNIKIARLVSAIDNEDFSLQFYENRKGDSFRELVQALNKVVERFGETRKAKEEAFQFLQSMMDHTPVSILVFDKQGQVEFCNRAIIQLLGVKSMANIEELREKHFELFQTLRDLGHEETRNFRLKKEAGLENLSIRATRFGLYGKVLTLVSMQNIHNELEGREMESWQKLMRVLTHEIMNSVTPISSLAETTAGLLEKQDFATREESLRALRTIQKRGEALLEFTRTYRSVTKLPQPHFEEVDCRLLLESVRALMEQAAGEAGAVIHIEVVEEIKLFADPGLLEQVLINLVLNALDAVRSHKNKDILLKALLQKGRSILTVEDQGEGIASTHIDKVFVPFFTTKEEGSGVGLSISRQLIRSMGGQIRLYSEEGKGTQVQLVF